MKRRKLGIFLFIIIAASLILIVFNLPKTEALISVHQCDYCHNMHAPQGPKLLPEIDAENTCLTCHAPGGSSSLKADVHINDTNSKYDPFRFTCLDCHDPHDNQQNILGSYNIKLVLASVDTPNSGPDWDVIFISRGTDVGDPSLYSFADADEDEDGIYTGICEVCHTLTKHHRNNDSGGHKHKTGKTCTNCHEHLNNFNK
ncbi:MAG: cytochrome c3 family protein [Candidatus Aminicenantia bacterium]